MVHYLEPEVVSMHSAYISVYVSNGVYVYEDISDSAYWTRWSDQNENCSIENPIK